MSSDLGKEQQNKVLTVKRLTQMLQRTLRNHFRDVWVTGEICNLSRPASGHVYLTLGGDDAQIKAVIWRSTAERINFDLTQGMEVICRGEIDVYPPRGVYQLMIRQVEPKGIGAQQLALKKLHARLAAEGLFDSERKKALPALPSRIAVVTSPSGAAIHDFLKVINRRWPHVEILIIPARVQGAGSVEEVTEGIRLAEKLRVPPDVLVVTRGGGSMEDLWSFNEEQVVRAIAACEIPVISAVGHEIDVTLSDLVADVRALTPSEAAERVLPEWSQINRQLNQMGNRLRQALVRTLRVSRDRLRGIESRPVLRDPQHLLNVACERVDDLDHRMNQSMIRQLENRQTHVASIAGRLHAVSPLNVLARGYSVTETMDGQMIRKAANLSAGQRLVTRVAEGEFESDVVRIR